MIHGNANTSKTSTESELLKWEEVCFVQTCPSSDFGMFLVHTLRLTWAWPYLHVTVRTGRHKWVQIFRIHNAHHITWAVALSILQIRSGATDKGNAHLWVKVRRHRSVHSWHGNLTQIWHNRCVLYCVLTPTICRTLQTQSPFVRLPLVLDVSQSLSLSDVEVIASQVCLFGLSVAEHLNIKFTRILAKFKLNGCQNF